jgi:hypothetical protein
MLRLVTVLTLGAAADINCDMSAQSLSPQDINGYRTIKSITGRFVARFTAVEAKHLWISVVPEDTESDPDIVVYGISDTASCLTLAYSYNFGMDIVSIPASIVEPLNVKDYFITVECLASEQCKYDIIFSLEALSAQPLVAGVTLSSVAYPGVASQFTFDCASDICKDISSATILVYPAALRTRVRICKISNCDPDDAEPVEVVSAWFGGVSASIDKTSELVGSRLLITVASTTLTATPFAVVVRLPHSVETMEPNQPYFGVSAPHWLSYFKFPVGSSFPDVNIYVRAFSGDCGLYLSRNRQPTLAVSEYSSVSGSLQLAGAGSGGWQFQRLGFRQWQDS